VRWPRCCDRPSSRAPKVPSSTRRPTA
jgi:hypothetical protein